VTFLKLYTFNTYFATGQEGVRNESERGYGLVDSQVGPHDDQEVTPFGNLGFEEVSVIDGLLRRVDRAGADDYEKSVVVSGQNSRRIIASRGDGLLGSRGRDNFMAEQSGLDERVILE